MPIRVLVACEFSGIVRDEFLKRGHNAMSCDLLPTESPGPHYQGDVRDLLCDGWDLMIAHPPCTFLTLTANRWLYHPGDKDLACSERRPHPRFPNRRKDIDEAADFFMLFASAPIERIAIENPIGFMSSRYRKPDQIIQPWMFGHPTTKSTCLWLKGLSPLVPTKIVEPEYYICKNGKRECSWHMETLNYPKNTRSKLRSITFAGVAEAMADQWG